jgi:hypothetical protein
LRRTCWSRSVSTKKFYDAYDQSLYSSLGLAKGIVFDKQNFGQQKLVTGYGKNQNMLPRRCSATKPVRILFACN